jgi:hypothetical protein
MPAKQAEREMSMTSLVSQEEDISGSLLAFITYLALGVALVHNGESSPTLW